MIQNNYHYRLNLPIKFDPIYLPPNPTQHNIYDLELLPNEFTDWFAKIGVSIMFGEQFLLDPSKRKTYYPHIDDPTTTEHVKINYVYSDDPHTMNWYKLKTGKPIITANTSIGTVYSWANKEDCDLVYCATVGTPSLVNVSSLHDVSPVTSIRYCFSFTLAPFSNPTKKMSWIEAETIFKDYIL